MKREQFVNTFRIDVVLSQMNDFYIVSERTSL